jgi:hypothetical protein
MNSLGKHSMLYHMHHAANIKMKNQYHTQTVAAEGPNATWTSTDFLGLVTIIVSTLLHKQVDKSGKASTLAA